MRQLQLPGRATQPEEARSKQSYSRTHIASPSVFMTDFMHLEDTGTALLSDKSRSSGHLYTLRTLCTLS